MTGARNARIIVSLLFVGLLAIPLTLGGVVGTWLLFNVPGTIIKYLMAATVTFIVVHTHLAKRPGPKSISKSSYALIIAFLFFY